MLGVSDLRITYRGMQGTVEALRGVSFEVSEGEFFTLLGPSGCGKTSTLRCVAGLETPSAGTISRGGAVVYSSEQRVNVPAHKRGFGMVFQSYAIWPHMTVFENVSFPLTSGVRKVPRDQVRPRVMRALGLVQLQDVADRPAPYLSGGQQQRVALARALALEPAVLLLDEPLSNLDAKLRDEMRHELKSLVGRLGITTLYVTHDQIEALSMSDRVALMHLGRIEQLGRPRDVYQSPASGFAARFLGRTNVLEGVVAPGAVRTAWGTFACEVPQWAAEGSTVGFGFRPENVVLAAARPEGSASVLAGTIAGHSFNGETVDYQVDIGGRTVQARGDPFDVLSAGTRVYLCLRPDRCYVLSLLEPHDQTVAEPAADAAPPIAVLPEAREGIVP
jgi:iron(III) transport system ATP-binding protein